MKRSTCILPAFLILLSLHMISCTKTNPMNNNGSGNSGNPVAKPATISSIDPATGPFNTTVTIIGTNFNPNPAADTVKFNGVQASVKSAGPDTLIVIVPMGAGNGAITVTVNGLEVTGPSFGYVNTLTVSTLAGNGYNALANGGFADGPGASAEFSDPVGIAVDTAGNVYVAEYGGHRLRKITPQGLVSSFAGTGYESSVEGTGSQGGFAYPWGAAIDAQGNIYVANIGDARIQKVTPSAQVSILAGHSAAGFADGTAAAAEFNNPYGVAVDAQGNIYIGDYVNNRIRKITPAAQVSTLAGNGKAGYVDGPGSSAEFNGPNGVAVDAKGNVYVADMGNERIRKITPDGTVSTLAGNGTNNIGHGGFADGPAASAEFAAPSALVVDAQGNVYVADAGNNCIREITTTGMVYTIAGNGNASYADGSGAAAEFNLPRGIAIDKTGNLYVTDYDNQRIRKITIQ